MDNLPNQSDATTKGQNGNPYISNQETETDTDRLDRNTEGKKWGTKKRKSGVVRILLIASHRNPSEKPR